MYKLSILTLELPEPIAIVATEAHNNPWQGSRKKSAPGTPKKQSKFGRFKR